MFSEPVLDDCPGKAKDEAWRTLNWINRMDLLTLYFREPERAKGQAMLSEAPVDMFEQWYVRLPRHALISFLEVKRFRLQC